MIMKKQLAYFFEVHDLDDIDYALYRSTIPFRLRKIVLNMDYPDRFIEHDNRPESDYEMFNFPLGSS